MPHDHPLCTAEALAGTQVAAHMATHTEPLGPLVAHRPGFVSPALAARAFATLDQFTGGRVAVYIITGGNNAEQRRDGDHLDEHERYDRTEEDLEGLERAWTQTKPFDHCGPYYRFEDFVSHVRPVTQPHIPLYFGGPSEAAYRMGDKRANTFARGASRRPRPPTRWLWCGRRRPRT